MAAQAWQPDLHHLHKEPDTAASTCYPNAEGLEMGGSLVLVEQPVQLGR